MRCGLIAKKLGMTRIWNADGRQVSVTVLSLEDVTVTALRTEEKHGYTAVQLGAGRRKPRPDLQSDAARICCRRG